MHGSHNLLNGMQLSIHSKRWRQVFQKKIIVILDRDEKANPVCIWTRIMIMMLMMLNAFIYLLIDCI